MPTECNPTLFDFARVEGRAVVAAFDGGRLTSDAGAVLLGAVDRAIGLSGRLAACFADARDPALVEHEVETLVMQRVIGIALDYEDVIDHDEEQRAPRAAQVGRATHAGVGLARLCCLSMRYERRADIHLAFTTLGCALVCLKQIRRPCRWFLTPPSHAPIRLQRFTSQPGREVPELLL